MTTYHGTCHCGAVAYEIDADIESVTRCTCSLCRKKGVLNARVEPGRLRVTRGGDRLRLYQFNKKIAKHFFCPDCGIHLFSNPRTAPERFAVNVNTLDDYDVDEAAPEVRVFDGRHWEEAFARQQQAERR